MPSVKNPHAVALGRLGGRAKSPKKTKAARANAAVSAWLRKQRKLHDPAPPDITT